MIRLAGGELQCGPSRRLQLESFGQTHNRVAVRKPPASFEVRHGAWGQFRAFGQLLLGEPRVETLLPQQLAKRAQRRMRPAGRRLNHACGDQAKPASACAHAAATRSPGDHARGWASRRAAAAQLRCRWYTTPTPASWVDASGGPHPVFINGPAVPEAQLLAAIVEAVALERPALWAGAALTYGLVKRAFLEQEPHERAEELTS